MSGIVDPRSLEHNYVVVNGITSPGKAIITGANVKWKYDVKSAYGLEGATTVFHGRDISNFTLTISLWAAVHFLQWAWFVKMLEPPTPGIPLVVEMKHPALTAADIKAVVVKELGQLERQSNGLWTSSIQCMEWRPPPKKPALVKPRGSIPGVEAGKVIPPKTEADIALAAAIPRMEAAYAASRSR